MARREAASLRLTMLVTVFMVIFIIGCGLNRNDPYVKASFHEGRAQFYFEYPNTYNQPFLDRASEPQSVLVTVAHPNGVSKAIDTEISVSADVPNTLFPDSKSITQYRMSEFESGAFFPNFKLIQRSNINVGGIIAEHITYSYSFITGTYGDSTPSTETWVGDDVYLDSNGLIWQLRMHSDSTREDKAKDDFDHILDTFKILD